MFLRLDRQLENSWEWLSVGSVSGVIRLEDMKHLDSSNYDSTDQKCIQTLNFRSATVFQCTFSSVQSRKTPRSKYEYTAPSFGGYVRRSVW